MTKPRKVCVVSGTRADYGHLKWLMRDLADDPRVDLQVLVTGAHLSPHHGLTVTEIERDGFAVSMRVDMLLAGDGFVAVAKSMGLGLIGFADAFNALKPDIVVVLGDRYEALAVAQAAVVMRIPIAHLHGGETTEGAFDEAMRHAISKMSYLHFVAAEPYKRRVEQLGEHPSRVFNFGAPGLDHLTRTRFLTKEELEEFLGLRLNGDLLLVTYHPVTLSLEDQRNGIAELIQALQSIPDSMVVITGVNADPESSFISHAVKDFAEANPDRVRMYDSLGSLRYLSLMRLCSAVVGNSSSGIIEAPAFGIATVNIGDRQKGRLRADSVVDCSPKAEDIAQALRQVLSPQGRMVAKRAASAYGVGDASKRIADVLATYPLQDALMKSFYDLPGADANREGA